MTRELYVTLSLGLLFLYGCGQNDKEIKSLKKKNKELSAKVSTLEAKTKAVKRERDSAKDLVKKLERDIAKNATIKKIEDVSETITPEKYEKVMRKFHDINFEFVSSGRATEFDQQEAWDAAAKSQGFKNRRDFEMISSKCIDKETMMEIIGRVLREHVERLNKSIKGKDTGEKK